MIGFLSSAWPFRGLEKTFCATTTKAISNLEELLKMSSRVISRIINVSHFKWFKKSQYLKFRL